MFLPLKSTLRTGSKEKNKGKQVDLNTDSPERWFPPKQRMNDWQLAFLWNPGTARCQESITRSKLSNKEL